jgi:cytochrome c553
MMKKSSLILLLCAAAVAHAALAGMPSGNADAGKKKASEVCKSCHGEDGNSVSAEFPRLAGQNADYLYNALTQYQAGKRKNPIMSGFAKQLNLQDMADVSSYFATQKGLQYKY